ncbi:MAG: response regulator transcription factor [bacterium]|nr:response regulator transcription factor [bacterium]
MSIRILLADDQELFLHGLRALLEQEPDLEVIGESRDGHEAVRTARELAPDLTIMDIGMPGLNGLEATRRIVAEHPGVKVLVLSVHQEARVIQSAFEAGAAGYLLKDCATEELVRGVRVVMSGKSFLSSEVAETVVDLLKSPRS